LINNYKSICFNSTLPRVVNANTFYNNNLCWCIYYYTYAHKRRIIFLLWLVFPFFIIITTGSWQVQLVWNEKINIIIINLTICELRLKFAQHRFIKEKNNKHLLCLWYRDVCIGSARSAYNLHTFLLFINRDRINNDI